MVSAPGAKSAASDCILLCFAVTGNYCACCMRRKCIITRTCTMSACTRWPAITIMMCNAFCRDRLLCREIDQSSSLVANVFILHRCRVRSPPPLQLPVSFPLIFHSFLLLVQRKQRQPFRAAALSPRMQCACEKITRFPSTRVGDGLCWLSSVAASATQPSTLQRRQRRMIPAVSNDCRLFVRWIRL